jgi:hypothetical protein
VSPVAEGESDPGKVRPEPVTAPVHEQRPPGPAAVHGLGEHPPGGRLDVVGVAARGEALPAVEEVHGRERVRTPAQRERVPRPSEIDAPEHDARGAAAAGADPEDTPAHDVERRERATQSGRPRKVPPAPAPVRRPEHEADPRRPAHRSRVGHGEPHALGHEADPEVGPRGRSRRYARPDPPPRRTAVVADHRERPRPLAPAGAEHERMPPAHGDGVEDDAALAPDGAPRPPAVDRQLDPAGGRGPAADEPRSRGGENPAPAVEERETAHVPRRAGAPWRRRAVPDGADRGDDAQPSRVPTRRAPLATGCRRAGDQEDGDRATAHTLG